MQINFITVLHPPPYATNAKKKNLGRQAIKAKIEFFTDLKYGDKLDNDQGSRANNRTFYLRFGYMLIKQAILVCFSTI